MTYTVRTNCLFCKSDKLSELFPKDYQFPVGNFVVENPTRDFHFIPYNIQCCNECSTVQTKYLGELNLIYENNFAGAFGTIRNTMNDLFAEFLLENKNVQSILEIGAGNGSLSESILNKAFLSYTIVDPSYAGPTENRKIESCYFEQYTSSDCPCPTTIVMSHVFEHFYDPISIIQRIQNMKSVQHIYISFPDLEGFIRNNIYHVLNPEHIYYVENSFLIDVFALYGFTLGRTYSHKNHSVFFEFLRSEPSLKVFPKNKTAKEDVLRFFNKALANISKVNSFLAEHPQPAYCWPCSMHTLFCMTMGLNPTTITSVLDNSPLKIGKYLYGYKHLCLPFRQIMESPEKKVLLLTGGCYNSEIQKEVEQNPQNTVFIL